MHYEILAFYLITHIDNPQEIVLEHKKFIESLDIACRIYIAKDGINGQMSASKDASKAYRAWMQQHPLFKEVIFKIDASPEQVFPRQTVKLKEKLVGGDEELDLSNRGQYMSPQEFEEKVRDLDNYCVLDIRNDYEWEVGHFKGAENPHCNNFRDFEKKAPLLAKELLESGKKALMYCTGGIRCEIYSSLLKKHGVKELYQLEGGVIEYGKQTQGDNWEGELFVFDDRLTVQINAHKKAAVSICHSCKTAASHYFNCANMDCNKLFICCKECLIKTKGCCAESCTTAPRLRHLSEQTPHKPFRRKACCLLS
jgi:UPF0176 protein